MPAKAALFAVVNTSLRLVFVASLCVGLTGCADALLVGARIVGAELGQLLYKATSRPTSWVQSTQPASVEISHCSELTAKGIGLTEPLELAIPTNEGEVQTFEATIWRLELEGERHPPRELQTPVGAEGTLAVTERSVLLVSQPDTAGVRIPYDVVLMVALNPVNPYSMTVKSCTGRFDIFDFRQRHTNEHDPEAAAMAVAQINARVAVIQAATDKGGEPPH
jgi:hypothetical protein